MSERDVVTAEAPLDPDADGWGGRDPSTFIVKPAQLWTARRPVA